MPQNDSPKTSEPASFEAIVEKKLEGLPPLTAEQELRYETLFQGVIVICLIAAVWLLRRKRRP